ncbi:6-carboxytetrahydropterin synthase [Clostridium sp. YIM B02551]|uniref:6-pyruvoyl trahydropterin synthase family protein n=1 Tax=Clostridium sp. YIM B02551 TaxID=2910679 RepID=UPI001EEB8D7E|nr:6-carboxytetrahydropterin synthase [Clostridium sp. YIM B02551]
MFILKSEIGFDSSHYLGGYNGKCANIHGHRYRLVIKVKGNKLKETGTNRAMVEDFNYIKVALKEIHDLFDHKLIIEDDEVGRDLIKRLEGTPQNFEYVLVPYRPTAEEMSRDIFNKIKEKGIDIYEVELFETPTNSCIYREDE